MSLPLSSLIIGLPYDHPYLVKKKTQLVAQQLTVLFLLHGALIIGVLLWEMFWSIFAEYKMAIGYIE